MARRSPLPLSIALEEVLESKAPQSLIAAVQRRWPEVAGERIAAACEPVSEHDGKVTFRCVSAVWAAELELMQSRLLEGLNAAIDGAPVRSLRFVSSRSRRAF